MFIFSIFMGCFLFSSAHIYQKFLAACLAELLEKSLGRVENADNRVKAKGDAHGSYLPQRVGQISQSVSVF